MIYNRPRCYIPRMKKTLCFLSLLLAIPASAVDFTFGTYSIWCDNMRYAAPGASTNQLIFQPEGSDIEKVTSAFGSHSTGSEGHWKVEFDIKATILEKNVGYPLLYIELTEKTKKGGNGGASGQAVIKTGWIMYDQQWSGMGYVRTAAGGLVRMECTRGPKFESRP